MGWNPSLLVNETMHRINVQRTSKIPIITLIFALQLVSITNIQLVVVESSRDDTEKVDHDNDYFIEPSHPIGTAASAASDDDDDNDDSNARRVPLKHLYGTEVSWPMQQVSPSLLRQGGDDADETTTSSTTGTSHDHHHHHHGVYMEYMNGCYETYGTTTCQYHDNIRIQRNEIQPQLVPRNYTSAGYAKVLAPTTTFTLLQNYWHRYSNTHLQYEIMNDPAVVKSSGGDSSTTTTTHSSNIPPPPIQQVVNLHINHWVAPTKILYLDPPSATSSSSLPQMSISNIQTMIHQVQGMLEQWTGVPLQFTSMYGIRSYTNHSILAPHIDRIPLVISAIVNVAQMVTEDWVLELIGHDGYAINVTMQPGEMIMYESHSILHGRPYPLNGQYYANCFFHFEPIGYTEQYYANLERQRRRRQTQQQPPQSSNADSSSSSSNSATGSSIHIPTTQELYEAALAKLAKTEPGLTSMSLSTTTNPSDASSEMPETSKRPLQLPFSILEGTIEAQRWRQEFEFRRVTLRHESWDDNGNGMIDETMFPKIIPKSLNKANAIGATNAHILAAKNDIVRLRKLAQTDPKSLDSTDNNGWLPLHEAARGGSTEVVQFLVEEVGIADINARTNNGKGGTALWWAEHGLPSNHKVIQILKRNGAISIAPFQEKKFEKYKKNPKAKGDNEEDRKGENTESDKEDKEGDVEEDEE